MRKHKSRRSTVRREAVNTQTQPVTIRAAMKAALDYWEARLQRTIHGYRMFPPELYQTYRRVVDGAGQDLIMLAEEGVHPRTVLDIMIGDQRWGEPNQWVRDGNAELRRLSSHRYWQGGRRVLERASEFLSSLTSHTNVRNASLADEEELSFVGLSKRAMEAARGVEELLKMIGELGLDQPGWMFQERSKIPRYPEIVRTGRRGRGRSGKSRQVDWAFCATMLYELFRRRTGKPHWGVIARLLHFAGYKGFAHAVPPEGAKGESSDQIVDRWDYKDKIRSRVENRLEDPRVVEAVEFNLSLCKFDLQRLGHYHGWGENLAPPYP